MKTLEELLEWAIGKAYIEILGDGSTNVEMFRDEFETVYSAKTLHRALEKAYNREGKGKCNH